MGRAAVAALVAVAAAMLGACGGSGDDRTPGAADQRYFTDLQSIQQQSNDYSLQIPALTDVHVRDGIDDSELAKLAAYFDVTRDLHAGIGDALRVLAPPSDVREAHFAYAEAVEQVRRLAANAEDTLEDPIGTAAALTGMARARTSADEACRALQAAASERGITVDLLCG